MEGTVARKMEAEARTNALKAWGVLEAVGQEQAPKKAREDSYTSEPSLFDKFTCFLSGMAYTGGSEIDANGKCQVKGKLIERNIHHFR